MAAKRVFKIGRSTDLVLAFLPFEKRFTTNLTFPCRFIGHTMADAMPLDPDKGRRGIARALPGCALPCAAAEVAALKSKCSAQTF